MRPAGSRSRLFLGILIGIASAFLATAVTIGPLALTHRDAGSLERGYADAVVDLTTRLGARGAGANPVAGTPRAVQDGQTAYNGVCAQCHGAAGRGDGVFGTTTFPPAADLAGADARGLSDGQLFYVIKHGLGFTPMPGYGDQYSDQAIWSLVSYVRTLQNEQGGRLPVGTPTSQQIAAARVPAGGDAQRGAVAFRAQGCVSCHGGLPGQVALSPQETMVAQAVRLGRQGMPCFAPARLSDAELADIIAYIALFPQVSGPVSPPQGQPGGGARPGGPGGPGGQGGGQPNQAPGMVSPCAASSGITLPPGPSGPGATPAR